MAEKRELIKVICQAVVLVKEGDKVLREEMTQQMSCYSLEEMSEFYAKAKAETEAMNVTNRKARRS